MTTVNVGIEKIKSLKLKIELLKSQPSILSPNDWNKTYMQLKGIKGLLEDSWEEIIKEYSELGWVAELRADPTFKQFYKLKSDLEELESLTGREE
jgi:hypothetical protein